MKIILEKAEQKHIKDIEKIEKTCFSTPWSEQSIAESLSNDASCFYVAYCDGNLAGYMGLQIFCKEGYVTNVAVLPQYRRMGVAKALISKQMENDMDFITLEVRESNKNAISLYSSFGFEFIGKRPKFYRFPNEDAILMRKDF